MADEWPRANDRNYCSTTPLLFAFFFFRKHLNRNVIYFLNKRTRATGRSTRTDYISAINRAVVRPPVLCGVYLLVFHFIPNHDHDCCKNAPSLYPFFFIKSFKKDMVNVLCSGLVWCAHHESRARAQPLNKKINLYLYLRVRLFRFLHATIWLYSSPPDGVGCGLL